MIKSLHSIIILFFIAAGSFAQSKEHVVMIFDLNDQQREELSQTLSVDHGFHRWGMLRVYVSDKDLIDLRLKGYHLMELPHPGQKKYVEMGMLTGKTTEPDWSVYPTYPEYLQLMQDFATDFPDKVRLVDIGDTQLGRELWVLKISDNPDVDEDEPEVFYSSTMHGDETTGYPMLLHFVWDMLHDYGSDAQMTALVDNLEIWVNPLANPDGTYMNDDSTVNGANRGFSDGRDPNRDFPDPRLGEHPEYNIDDYAIETQAMMSFTENHHFIVSANFHGGAEVFNYPWDTWCAVRVGCGVLKSHPDEPWYQSIGHHYADQAQADGVVAGLVNYMTSFDDGITNGGDWYIVAGGRQDYMNYWQHSREVTIELSNDKMVPGGSLPAYYQANKQPLIDYLNQSLGGVRGVVVDGLCRPLDAVISLTGLESDGSEAVTDPVVGDYHRVAVPGSYTVNVSSNAYVSQSFSNVVVSQGNATRLDVSLNIPGQIMISGFEENCF